MIIYGALLIPIIVAILLFALYRKQTVWWEFVIPMAVSLLVTFVMKFSIESSQVTSTEYWGTVVSKAEYYEEWDEKIEKTCEREYGCDNDGKNCKTESYDCSYIEDHDPYWEITTIDGGTFNVDEEAYAQIKKRFGNEEFVDLHRDYHSKDGDKYVSTWKRDSASSIPIASIHSYENRIKAADQSVFHFRPVDTSDMRRYQLKDYPPVTGYGAMASVLGDNSKDALIADRKMQYINGMLGAKKQVHTMLLVFKNQPIAAAFAQEALWSGGNKNEFIVCIGTDDQRNVTWCKVLSWTPSEELKVYVRSFVEQQKVLSLTAIAEYLQPALAKDFQRKHFREFSYLTVEPPLWGIVLTYIITLIVNIGLSVWIVNNEFEEENSSSNFKYE